MEQPDRDAHHIPGYTGFLPGNQHQMAKTYGQASKATLSERVASEPTPIQARDSSSETTHMATLPRPAPP